LFLKQHAFRYCTVAEGACVTVARSEWVSVSVGLKSLYQGEGVSRFQRVRGSLFLRPNNNKIIKILLMKIIDEATAFDTT
jgi:uncharacterized protein involved in tellurium resistance